MTVSYAISPELHNWQINDLMARVYRGSHRDRDWRPVLKRSLCWVCAYSGANRQLVGFVNVAWDGGVHAFILDTAVHPDYQRQGIGTALVGHAVEQARSHRMDWVHVDYEPHLDDFYKGCGFRHTAAGVLDLHDLG